MILELRLKGLTTQKIAEEVGLSRRSVEIKLNQIVKDRPELRKVFDEIRRKNLMSERINLEGIPAYQIGIIWSIGGYVESEGTILFRHKDRHFLEQIEPYFESTIYQQHARTGTQYALKTSLIDIEQLREMGWTNRNSDQRNLPELEDYTEFLRAYIEIHSTLDYCISYSHGKKNRCKRLRLRIYGNNILIASVNAVLNRFVGTGIKKAQPAVNGKTHIIAYTSYAEICRIIDYVTGSPANEEYWTDADEKLKQPVKME